MLQQSSAQVRPLTPKQAFISYAHADENAQKFLLLALSELEREGLISAWHDRRIMPGEDWDHTINARLSSADLILFLVSPNFLKSSYCRDVEVQLAFERAARNEVVVVPIILIECNWRDEEFARLQALPIDGAPITQANGSLSADLLQSVIEGLRFALTGIWPDGSLADKSGATTTHSSAVLGHSAKPLAVARQAILQPSEPFAPVLTRGLVVDHRDIEKLHFINDTGTNADMPQERLIAEGHKLSCYFWEFASLSSDKDVWVNFSPYESNRMLPSSLSGTYAGRDLLECDCQLKHFAASLMHPDTDTGRRYWKELYGRAREKWGTSKLPVQCYHKVWILADTATVFVKERNVIMEDLPGGLDRWGRDPESTFGFVVEHHLAAHCDVDVEAFQHNRNASASSGPEDASTAVNAMATAVFKEMILPLVEREVNEGRHLATFRQIFHSLILANWFKKNAHTMPDIAQHYREVFGSNSPTKTTVSLYGIENLQTGFATPIREHARLSEGLGVPENREYYRRYVAMFKNGLYHVVRQEEGDRSGDVTTRVYFSGGVDFASIACTRIAMLPERMLEGVSRGLLSPR